MAVLYFILWPRGNDCTIPRGSSWKGKVDGCKFMMDTELFGSLWELYHQVLTPPAWGRGWWGECVAPLACYSESLRRRSLIKCSYWGEDSIDSTFHLFFILFYFFPRRWPYTERTILLIHRRTLPSRWKITFWRLSKWVFFPTLPVTLRCLFYICKISTCVTVVLWKSVTKMLAVYFELLLEKYEILLLCENGKA